MNVDLNMACGAGDLERARAALGLGDPSWVAWAMAGQAGHAEVLAWLAEVPLPDADRHRGLQEASKLAAQNGHLSAVRALLAAGAAPPARPERGALHAASQNGHLAIVDALLAAGWAADTPCEDGSTPLAEATLAQRAEVVKRLLAAGADPRHADALGVSPVSLARTHGLTAMSELLGDAPQGRRR